MTVGYFAEAALAPPLPSGVLEKPLASVHDERFVGPPSNEDDVRTKLLGRTPFNRGDISGDKEPRMRFVWAYLASLSTNA